jgi:cysteine dioxygenase type I
MSTVTAPQSIPVEEFVDRLRTLSEGVITKQAMYEFLVSYEIRPADLERFKIWMPDRHTRNKIFRNGMVEAMLICWPVGAITPLHTHNGQLGWMTMLEGKLIVENYRKIDCNRPENQQVVGMDCLAGATRIEMKQLGTELCVPGGPLNTVDKRQTIHRIKNLPEWNERAVSLHVYSFPFNTCVVYSPEKHTCGVIELHYNTEYGLKTNLPA